MCARGLFGRERGPSAAGGGTVGAVTDLITNPDHPSLAPFRGLQDHAARQRRERPGGDMAGWLIAEGDLVMQRGIDAGMELESVLVDGARTRPLPAWASTTGGPAILRVGPDVLVDICGRPKLRDPIGCFVRPGPRDAAALLHDATTVLVAEGVNNPTNMGVLLRNAAALGADAVLLDPSCCDPFYRRSVRVSMGQVFAVPHARMERFPESFGVFRSAGFETLALTSGGDEDIGLLRFPAQQKLALVVGAEGPGLTDDTLRAADRRVQIPMSGTVDSLNVATASALALWAVQQARR